MAMMTRLHSRFRSGKAATRTSRTRRVAPQLNSLEDRQLLYFGVTATAVPSTLWPPNSRYVPVAVSGTFREYALVNGKQVFENLPGAKAANFQVVDEYHRDDPSGPLQMIDEGHGQYGFAFTINLQAERANEYIAGRRYYVLVAVKDSNGWAGKTVPVQVPHSLKDRGPGPQTGKPTPAYIRFIENQHKKPASSGSSGSKGIGSIFNGL
jgi:hypothetical protein